MKRLPEKEKAQELLRKHGIRDATVNLLQIKELIIDEKDRNYWERVGVYLTIFREEEIKKKKSNPLDWILS
jgi:hypothetical protein